MSAWLADYEMDALRRVAAEKHGRALEPEDFLREVVLEAEERVNQTQPVDDLSHFTLDDLTEEDRKELLSEGGFDVESPAVLDVVTAMPAHTIISDGSARRIALKRALLFADGQAPAFRLFAETGAVRPELRAELDDVVQRSQGREREDLERLERYLDAEPEERGVQPGWQDLDVPDWVDRSLAPDTGYLKPSQEGPEPSVEH